MSDKKVRSFSISSNHKEKITKISKAERRSLSNTIAHIIGIYLKENGSK